MEYNLKLEEHKQCWLMKYNCPCRAGTCYLNCLMMDTLYIDGLKN